MLGSGGGVMGVTISFVSSWLDSEAYTLPAAVPAGLSASRPSAKVERPIDVCLSLPPPPILSLS